jgi:protein TonB
MSRGRDLAGWLGAGAVTAALFAGAAAAALRLPDAPSGHGVAAAAGALDLSVGVMSMAAALPATPPPVVVKAPEVPMADMAPPERALPVPPSEALPVAMPRPDLVPVLPQAEPPPAPMAVPPPPQVEPPLEMAESPRPRARPQARPVVQPATPERAVAEAPPEAPEPKTPEPKTPAPEAPKAEAPASAPAAGAAHAARPAEVRRAAGGAARYGDAVMRQIAKLRRPKAPERGTVTVGFEIGGDGGLRRVTVVASSGSAALDAVAMDHIRRAAPFPPPPEGAATRFAFEFVGR